MPPASSPKRLQILQAAATRLRAINGGASFWYSVRPTSVQIDVSVTLLNLPSTNLPAFMLEAADPSGERIPEGAGIVKETFDFMVIGRVDVDGSADTDRKVTAGEKLAADIETAFATDFTGDGRLGMPNLVNGVWLFPPEVIYDAGPVLAVFVGQRIRVSYKRRGGEP